MLSRGGAMLDQFREWAAAFDWAAVAQSVNSVLPSWWPVAAGFFFAGMLCAMALTRRNRRFVARSIVVVIILAAVSWWVFDRDRAARKDALDARAFDLAARAL